MARSVKLFDDKLIAELSVYHDYGYAGGAGLIWNEEMMDKHHPQILKIIHKKLDGKVLVFHHDIIDLNKRVTTYGIIRNITWSEKYKTCFCIEYSRICLKVDDEPCIRLMDNDTSYVQPKSSYSVISKNELDKLIDNTLFKIKKALFKYSL
jgi:hypothetical protein